MDGVEPGRACETGYYYFRNRYLDPALGRFASRDPLGMWGDAKNLGNGYTYAASNPWSMVDPFGLCSGNSFWGNFFGGIVDPETYRDYALSAYGQAALGIGDWAKDLGEMAVHNVRMRFDPFYARKVWIERYDTAKAIVSDPGGAYDAMGTALYDYVTDFDARDAGKLMPDLVGAGLGLAEARGAKAAAEAGEAAGDVARALRKGEPKTYDWTPRSKPPLAASGEDLYVGPYSKSYRANVKAGINADHTPHHSLQDAVSRTTRARGVTMNMRQDLHSLTRTFKRPVESGLSLRQHLAGDVMDIRSILIDAGYNRSTINRQLQELIGQNKTLGGLGKK